jgi:cytochrome P450
MLSQDPELAESVRSSSGGLDDFTEEVLRLASPVQGLYRTATEDTELSGVRVPAGSYVLVLYAAANQDPSMFECPHQVRLERPHARSHVAFGKGIHHCIGAPLARAEGRIGFAKVLARLYPWRLSSAENAVRWRKSFILNGPASVHVDLDEPVRASQLAHRQP